MAAHCQIRLFVLFFLSVLFTASFANLIEVDAESITYRKITSNISSIVDSMLPSIRKHILKQELDPLKLDDITNKLPGIIIHNRIISLTNGWLQGLSNIRRTNDVILIYDDQVLTVDATFGFDVLDCNYEYTFKDSLITRKGVIDGRFTNIELRIIASMNLKDRKIILQAVNIVRVDQLELTLKGHVFDPVLNAIIKGMTNTFRKSIISMVEKQIALTAQQYLDKLGEKIPTSQRFLLNNDMLEHVPTSFNFQLI